MNNRIVGVFEDSRSVRFDVDRDSNLDRRLDGQPLSFLCSQRRFTARLNLVDG